MSSDLPEGAPVMLRMSIERENGYLAWLGVRMDDIEHGRARLHVPFDDKFTDAEADREAVHEGIVTSLVAETAELAIRTTMSDPVNDRVEALNLDVTFIEAAAHDLEAVGEVIDRGGGSAVAEVAIESRTDQGFLETIASGRGVFRTEDGESPDA